MNPVRPAVRRRRWLYAFAVPIIASGLLGIWSVGARAATPVLGSLAFLPPSGTADDPITLQTVSAGAQKGCPSGTQAVTGWVDGPAGSEWVGVIGVGTTSTGVSTTDEMTFPLADTFSGLAAQNSIALVAGQYDLRITCRSSGLGGVELGTFVGSVSLAVSQGTWRFTSSPAGPTPTTTTGPTPSTTGTASPTAAPTAQPTPTASTSSPPATAPGLQSLGTLTFLPAEGADVDPITALTHSTSPLMPGCPVGATFVDGKVFGPGDWAAGIQAVTKNSVATLGAVGSDFLAQLGDTFFGLAATNALSILPGRYDLVLTCSSGFVGQTPLGTFTGSIFFTDAHRYQTTDPNSGAVETATTVTASPDDRAELGQQVTLTAEVAPATASGSVQFTDRIGESVVNVGAPVPVVAGRAVLKRSTLTFGLHLFSASFVPTDAAKAKASASDDLVYVVAKALPPLPPTRAILSGGARVGQTLTCSGSFRGATSTKTNWLRDGVAIPRASAGSYRVTSRDSGHWLGCRITATNAGGTTHRTSVYAKVTG